MSSRAAQSEAALPASQPENSSTSISPTALSITDLRKSFDGREVVSGISLEAKLGQVTSVLGPNGAGKTTTIECCEGLRVPDSGSIRIFGLDPQQDRSKLSHRVGVMLQDGGLPNSVKAIDMLTHVSKMYADPWDVADLVSKLGIDSFAKTTVRRLSGGQRQRLALAAALVGRPQLLFLDEPSAGMDPQSRHAVWDLIRQLRDQGAAILLTTHLMDEAEALSDQVYIVDHGKVIASGSPSELGRDLENQLTFQVDGSLELDRLVAHLDQHNAVSMLPSGALRVTGAVTPLLISRIAQWCEQENLTITSLSAGAHTLEDVFLELTGRSLR